MPFERESLIPNNTAPPIKLNVGMVPIRVSAGVILAKHPGVPRGERLDVTLQAYHYE